MYSIYVRSKAVFWQDCIIFFWNLILVRQSTLHDLGCSCIIETTQHGAWCMMVCFHFHGGCAWASSKPGVSLLDDPSSFMLVVLTVLLGTWHTDCVCDGLMHGLTPSAAVIVLGSAADSVTWSACQTASKTTANSYYLTHYSWIVVCTSAANRRLEEVPISAVCCFVVTWHIIVQVQCSSSHQKRGRGEEMPKWVMQNNSLQLNALPLSYKCFISTQRESKTWPFESCSETQTLEIIYAISTLYHCTTSPNGYCSVRN